MTYGFKSRCSHQKKPQHKLRLFILPVKIMVKTICMMWGGSIKILDTERLFLRRWSIENIDDFHELMHSPSCIAGGWKPSTCREDSLDILKLYVETDGIFAIFLKESGKAIGFIKIYPDNNRGKYYAKMINYLLNENYWNNGYMTEAVKCIVRYAFEDLNIDLLSAFTTPQNIGSKSVLEKSKFIYEGTIKNGYKRCDGEIFDSVIYSISKSDYYKK